MFSGVVETDQKNTESQCLQNLLLSKIVYVVSDTLPSKHHLFHFTANLIITQLTIMIIRIIKIIIVS